MSRYLRAVFLIVVLLAAQAVALSHALDHSLQAETDGCLVCHVAEQFDDGTSSSQSRAVSKFAFIGAVEASVNAPYSQVLGAFQARAPPVLSS
jgi:hypothetical protein